MTIRLPRIATTTTIRAPVKETLLFVRYHLNAGIEKMFLFFDDPVDPAISHLANDPRVCCVRCDENHWRGLRPDQMAIEERQHYNSSAGLALARHSGIEWLIHIDSDELVYSRQDLRRLFSALDESVDVLHFPTLEAIPNRLEFDNVFTEVNFFKVSAPQIFGRQHARIRLRLRLEIHQRARRLVRLLTDRDLFADGFLLGHVLGKSATRTAAPIASIWNHYPNPEAGATLRTKVAAGAWLLHYDAGGFDAWVTKWQRRYNNEAYCIGIPPRRHQQGERFISLYCQGDIEGLKQLYQALYFLSPREIAVLSGFGYVRKVKVPESRFS